RRVTVWGRGGARIRREFQRGRTLHLRPVIGTAQIAFFHGLVSAIPQLRRGEIDRKRATLVASDLGWPAGYCRSVNGVYNTGGARRYYLISSLPSPRLQIPARDYFRSNIGCASSLTVRRTIVLAN